MVYCCRTERRYVTLHAGCGRDTYVCIMVQLAGVHTPVSNQPYLQSVFTPSCSPMLAKGHHSAHVYTTRTCTITRLWTVRTHANNSLLTFISFDEEINNVSRQRGSTPKEKVFLVRRIDSNDGLRVVRGVTRFQIPRGSAGFIDCPGGWGSRVSR